MNRRVQADFALALCSLLWGATFVVVQDALADASVFTFLALRFTLAAVLMAAIYHRDLRRVTSDELRAGFIIGLFMFGGYVFQTAALLITTPSKTAFITGFGVVLVPILMAVLWGRRINAWIWSGALGALGGLYFLTVPAAGLAHLSRGDLLAFVCAVLFALQVIFVGRYSPRYSVGGLSFLQVATSAALSLAALPLLAITRLEPPRAHLTGGLIFAVLVTAVLATAVAFSVQVWAQQYTSATHTALLLALEPVFAALTSFIVLHERLGARALAGAALILGGILVAELKGPVQASADATGAVRESSPNN